MQTTRGDVAGAQNGPKPRRSSLAEFYSRLSSLEDTVRSGLHPRFKLPIDQFVHLNAALDRFSAKRLNGGLPETQSRPQLPPAHRHSVDKGAARVAEAPVSQGAATRAGATHLPELATRQDILDRRRLVEASLQTQRRKARSAYGYINGPIEFDGGRILEEALLRVPHVSGLQPPIANGRSETSPAPESSYYSSKVNSWTSEDTQHNRGEPQIEISANLVPVRANQGRVTGLGPPNTSLAPQNPDKQPILAMQSTDATGQSFDGVQDIEDARDDSYSPPPVEAFPETAQRPLTQTQDSSSNEHWLPRENGHDRDSESYSPPSLAPLPSNHFHAPVAQPPPQLAALLAGMPGLISNPQVHPSNSHIKPNFAPAQAPRNEKRRPNRNKTTQQRKAAQVENLQRRNDAQHGQSVVHNPRKRRRVDETAANESRRVSANHPPAVESDMPYVKEEPLSPVPLWQAHPSDAPRRLVIRDDGADIEVLRPQNGSRVPSRVEARRLSAQNMPYPEADATLLDSPTANNGMQRYHVREQPDLRRVASVHHAARPVTSAHDRAAYGNVGEPQLPRARSTILVEQPPRYMEAYGTAEERVLLPRTRLQEEYLSPRAFSDQFSYQFRPSEAYPPPPKQRIIVDDQGVEYIAVPRNALRQPLPYSSPSYHESGPPYAPSYAHEMPQRPIERRVYQPPPPQVIDLEADDPTEDYRRMPPPRSVPRKRVVEIIDDEPSRPIYYETERAPRAYSAQPMPVNGTAPYRQVLPAAGGYPMAEDSMRHHERSFTALPDFGEQGRWQRLP